MGAALTYARRYALFTLVGIAGEDDVDAPDLTAPPAQAAGIEKPPPSKKVQLNGGQSHIPHGRAAKSVPRPILGAAPSAALRDRLVGELKDIASGDDAALWAHQILSDKNSLTDADARLLEDAFQVRLTALESVADLRNAAVSPALSGNQLASSVERRSQVPAGRTPRAEGVDKSQLVHPEPRRLRDKEHVKFVAKQPCLVCGRRPSDAHHLRFAQHRALGRKVSDEFTVPLCRGHHREVHRCGDEAAWWIKAGIDPTVPARALWLETHPLPTASHKTDLDGTTALSAVNSGRQQARSADGQGRPKIQNEANYRGWRSMTSFRQIEANRRNARKSTGPNTEEGKQRSRCNAVRHGLTAETVIGALEDAEDYKAFEAAITADYDAQSAVERELVLRLASLLWRLRRATTMETGLFEIQADHLRDFRQSRPNSTNVAGNNLCGVRATLILSMPTSIEHRSDLQMERKRCPARGGNALIPPSTLHVAFCVWPICPVTRSTV